MIALQSTLECGRRSPRGQPVIALVMIICIWIAVRVTVVALDGDPQADKWQLARPLRPAPDMLADRQPAAPPTHDHHSARLGTLAVPYVPRRGSSGAGRRQSAARFAAEPQPVVSGDNAAFSSAAPGAIPLLPEKLAAAYDLPATDRLPETAPRLAYLAASPQGTTAAAGDPPQGPEPRRLPHWSADGWLLLRGGDQPPALAAGTAAYGGSQAGAVLRYGLAPSSALRPQAYVRVSGALGGRTQQSELALGLMVRPVKHVPIAVLGEWRLQQQPGQTRTRPVVMAITQLPPLRLPLDIEAEAYAQGGWAGGRDATPFYDLAATLQRRVLRPLSGTQLSAGGGVWSGGQRGAVRLDVGPRVELRGMLGPPTRRIGVRVGVDWRFRVAGKAEPGSGPALTVAAGF